MVVLAAVNSVYLSRQNRLSSKALFEAETVPRGEGDLDIHFKYIT